MVKTSRFFYLKVELDTHWGYSFRRVLFSKTRDSYLLPPPTTLIGALAYGLARIKGLPEEISVDRGKAWASSAELLRRRLASVNVMVNTPLHHHSDLSRIWWFRARESRAKYDAVALGKVYSLTARPAHPHLSIIYVFEEEPDDKEELVAAAHSIVRLGCKEGIVSVRSINYGVAEVISSDVVSTKYSFWLDLAESVEGEVLIQNVVDFKESVIGDYTRAKYRQHAYPYSQALKTPTEARVKLRKGIAKALKVDSEVVIIESK